MKVAQNGPEEIISADVQQLLVSHS